MSQPASDGPDRVPPWEAFSGGDGPPPGPGLAALLGEAVADLGRLDDAQLLGAGSAARRLAAHAGYLELMAVAEFARRREEQFEASKARGDRVRSRDGEYPAEELGFEMTATAYSAAVLMDMAQNIAGRLPSTLAGMAAGRIDRDRARAISNATIPCPTTWPRSPTRPSPTPRRRSGSPTCSRRPPGSRPASTPRACGRARRRRGGTGGSSCAARTPAPRAWPAGSSTPPTRWRGRRRSTPRRSGSATRAWTAPWPRSGR